VNLAALCWVGEKHGCRVARMDTSSSAWHERVLSIRGAGRNNNNNNNAKFHALSAF
jgi:hypothetical protein